MEKSESFPNIQMAKEINKVPRSEVFVANDSEDKIEVSNEPYDLLDKLEEQTEKENFFKKFGV